MPVASVSRRQSLQTRVLGSGLAGGDIGRVVAAACGASPSGCSPIDSGVFE